MTYTGHCKFTPYFVLVIARKPLPFIKTKYIFDDRLFIIIADADTLFGVGKYKVIYDG